MAHCDIQVNQMITGDLQGGDIVSRSNISSGSVVILLHSRFHNNAISFVTSFHVIESEFLK
jgi:hypothetical protein